MLLAKWQLGHIKTEADFRVLLGLIPKRDDHIKIPSRDEIDIDWIRRIISGDQDHVRDRQHIKLFLADSSAHPDNLDYYFRGDRVFNVVADGVSDLSLRRADYNSIVKEEGYDRLLAHIRDSIAEYEAGETDG